MDIVFSEEDGKWRQEVREFITKEAPHDSCVDDLLTDLPETDEWWEFSKGFTRKLGAKGWIGLGWPKKFGGEGAGPMKLAILGEELAYSRAPIAYGINTLTAPIMTHGSPELQEEMLPKIARGEVTSSLQLSEAEAGSDLANVKTKAVKNGDYYIVDGQKIFNSLAHRCDYGLLIALTDSSLPKRRNVTRFCVDLKSPGITFSAQWNMTGRGHRQNVTYYDSVRIPTRYIIGKENQAWQEMPMDRAATPSPGVSGWRRQFDDFLDFCKDVKRNGRPLVQEPLVRHELMDLAVELQVMHWIHWQMISEAQRRRDQPTQERGGGLHTLQGSVLTFMWKEWAPRFAQAATRIVGPIGLVRAGSKWAPQVGVYQGWVERFYRAHGFDNHRHGTPEVLRMVVATRGLGLPR